MNAARLRPIRIVIADDHPIFRDGLKHLLGQEPDFQVVAEIGHGDDVLPAVEAEKPDILLLDLKMHGTHGLTILQRLQLASNGVTKVIVLTASEEKSELVHAMKLGARGIVSKQSPSDLLSESIRKVVAGEPSNGRSQERSPLSQREREIVALVAQGFKNREIAEKMFFGDEPGALETIRDRVRELWDRFRGGGPGPRPPTHPIPGEDSRVLNRQRSAASAGTQCR